MEKTIARQKDWPAWAEWFAVDGNCDEWVYAQKPRHSDRNDYWTLNGVGAPMACVYETGCNNYGLRKDWRDTLCRIADAPVKEAQGSVDLETASHKCKVCAELDECGRVTAWILREGKDCLGFDITPFKSTLGAATEKALPEKEFKPGDKFTTSVGDVVTPGEWNGSMGYPIRWSICRPCGDVEICRINEDRTTWFNWPEIERIAKDGPHEAAYINSRIAMLLLSLATCRDYPNMADGGEKCC